MSLSISCSIDTVRGIVVVMSPMLNETGVQWRSRRGSGSIPGLMVDPLEHAEETTERIALDISPDDLAFLERYAAYRNVMNDLQSRSVRQKWSRKSAGEALLSAQIQQLREQMAGLFAELGEFPRGEKELREYAEKVLARSERPKKSSR